MDTISNLTSGGNPMTPIPDDVVLNFAKETDGIGCDVNSLMFDRILGAMTRMSKRDLQSLAASYGMVMVPREPTKEMIEAAFHDYMEYERQGPTKPSWNCLTMWEAMIAASPHKEGE